MIRVILITLFDKPIYERNIMENKKMLEKLFHQCVDELPKPITKNEKQLYYSIYYGMSEELKSKCNKLRKGLVENTNLLKVPIWDFIYITKIMGRVKEIERRNKMK